MEHYKIPLEIAEILCKSQIDKRMVKSFTHLDLATVLQFLDERGDDVLVCTNPITGVVIFSKMKDPCYPHDYEYFYQARYIERRHPQDDIDEPCMENWIKQVDTGLSGMRRLWKIILDGGVDLDDPNLDLDKTPPGGSRKN